MKNTSELEGEKMAMPYAIAKTQISLQIYGVMLVYIFYGMILYVDRKDPAQTKLDARIDHGFHCPHLQ